LVVLCAMLYGAQRPRNEGAGERAKRASAGEFWCGGIEVWCRLAWCFAASTFSAAASGHCVGAGMVFGMLLV